MKKGFTLIELLAVIIILAIIALISTPIIIGLIDDARKESFKSSAYGIIKSGEIYYAKNMMSGTNEEVTFKYTSGVETSILSGKNLDYNGTKPKSGKVKVNKEGQVAIAIHNGTYCAEKGYNESEVILSDKTEAECISVLTWLYEDKNLDGIVNVGDIITFRTESFYVISNDGTDIKALVEFNLYVGGTYNGTAWTPYGDEDGAIGLQNSEMIGYVGGQTVRNGTTPFSSDEIRGTNYSAYEGSIVEGYVNSYKTKLEGLGANIQEATLITKEELDSLGCSSVGYTCNSAPNFVYSTSYWSGSAFNADIVWYVFSDGSFSGCYYGFGSGFGVRPVITISSSEI